MVKAGLIGGLTKRGRLLVSVDRLIEDPRNERKTLRNMEGLIQSVKAFGIIEPITATPEGDTRDGFNQFEPEPIFAAATECNTDAACWARKLSDASQPVVQKAAYMVARYGRGDATAITALVGALSNRDESSVAEILYALDHVALTGSPEAVTRIETMRTEGGGTSFWNHIQSLALAIHARLQARGEAAGG